MYETESVTNELWTDAQKQKGEKGGVPLTIIGKENYNRILALQQISPIELGKGQYAVSYAFPPIEDILKTFSKNPKPIQIGDVSLQMAKNGLHHQAWENKNVLLEDGTIIIPQHLTEGLTPIKWVLNFNFADDTDKINASLYEKWFKSAPDGLVL